MDVADAVDGVSIDRRDDPEGWAAGAADTEMGYSVCSEVVESKERGRAAEASFGLSVSGT